MFVVITKHFIAAMTDAILPAGLFLAAAITLQFGGLALVGFLRRRRPQPGIVVPPVSILVPACGLENHVEETLSSAFLIEAPEAEVLFCVADEADPVVPLIRRLIATNPQRPAQLLIGDERPSGNPKLNNLLKGWAVARHDWVVMADSNVLLPKDAVRQMLDSWDERTGLVCSPPAGILPDGFAAEVEAGFLDAYQARWQLIADSLGFGFGQGKAMLCRRSDFARFGGLIALAAEPGEDAAATKLLRGVGLKVRLVGLPFGQPLGRRTLAAVWNRQLRWARLRRASFPALYVPEILAGLVPAWLAALVLVHWGALPAWALLALSAGWYAAEALLCRSVGWPAGLRSLPAWVVRDLLLPVLWVAGWGRGFTWRGNPMTTDQPRDKARAKRDSWRFRTG